MSHPILSFPPKKPPYTSTNFRSSDLKVGLKNNIQILHIKFGYKLDRLSQILYKRIQKNYFICFQKLKKMSNLHNNHFYDKRIDKCFERILEIIKRNQYRSLFSAFHDIKSLSDTKNIIQKMNFLQIKVQIKSLAASFNMTKLQKIILGLSKSRQPFQQSLKVRYFMGLCENILSKKNISKELYKSFREWHLQSILKKLSNLNEEQKEMAYQQKQISSRLIKHDLINILGKVFSKLKVNCESGEPVNLKITYYLMISYLIEKISIPFLKHALLLFPNLKWSVSQYDALFMLKMSFFFKKMQRYVKGKRKTPVEKSKTVLHMINIFKRREFMNKEFAYRKLQQLDSQQIPFPLQYKNKKYGFIECKSLLLLLNRSIEKVYSAVFQRLNQIQPKFISKELKLRSKEMNIQKGLNLLTHFLGNNLQNNKRIHFKIWKKLISSASQIESKSITYKKISTIKMTSNCNKLKRVLANFFQGQLRNSFYTLVQYSNMSNPRDSIPNQVLVARAYDIPAKKTNLLDMIKNQSIVNEKLEKSHRRKVTESSLLIQRYKQINAIETLLYKDFQRKQDNTRVLQQSFRKWQAKISFEDAKIKEYKNLINILEGERDIVAEEIQQLEQLRVENAAIYLNCLEEVNSQLMERIETYNIELEKEIKLETNRLEDQEGQDDEVMPERKRTLSI